MLAYANPENRLQNIAGIKPGDTRNADADWADGYGLIRFHKNSGEVTFECWPRFADVTKPGARQFPGWPQTVKP